MLRAIQEIKPKYVVGENVAGLLSWNGGLVFNEVQVDLENEGYEVQPVILPACGVNAPHRRDRVWFIAKNTMLDGWGSIIREEESGFGGFGNIGSGNNERIFTNDAEVGVTSNPNNTGSGIGLRVDGNGSQENEERKEQPQSESWKDDSVTSNPTSTGREERIADNGWRDSEEIRTGLDDRPERSGELRDITNSKYRKVVFAADCIYEEWDEDRECPQCPECGDDYCECGCPGPTQDDLYKYREFNGILYARPHTNYQNIRLQRQRNTGKVNRKRKDGIEQPVRFCNNKGWSDFPTQSPVCSRNDGLQPKLVGITIPKHRTESIKAYGNAIVPQVALQIFKAIAQIEVLEVNK
jgi:DNA (cytosine-5)-methyltransferase 1